MRYAALLMLLTGAFASGWSIAASTEEVTRTATGYGESPQAAVTHALVEASRQALGVSVALDPDFRRQVFDWVAAENLVTGKWTSHAEARAPTLANVAGYRVISTREIKNELWQAEVEARLVRAKPVGPDRSALPSLVVAPVDTSGREYHPGVPAPAQEVSRRLHQALVTAFTQTGRVRVLDRRYPDAFRREQEIAAASLSALEHARVGQQLGADLLLTTEVEEFRLGREGEAFYGAKLNIMEPVVRVHYQMLDTATREIIAAGTWQDDRSASLFVSKLREAGIEPDRDASRVGEVLYPDTARALVDQALQVLYPLRVLSVVNPERVYISQGGGRLDEGDLLSVHPPGQAIRDPDTGVALHLEGPSLATLRVREVATGYALAELVSGEPGALNADAVVRRAVPVLETPQGNPRPLTPGSSEAPLRW